MYQLPANSRLVSSSLPPVSSTSLLSEHCQFQRKIVQKSSSVEARSSSTNGPKACETHHLCRWACSLMGIQLPNQASFCFFSKTAKLAVQMGARQAGVDGRRDLCRFSKLLLSSLLLLLLLLLMYATTRCQERSDCPALLGVMKESLCASYSPWANCQKRGWAWGNIFLF